MPNEPTFTLELTAQEAALVCLIVSHAVLATVNPTIKPPNVTLQELTDVYHIAHQLAEQILTQEHSPMDPLIHTLSHLHGDLATARLLLDLLQEATTPGTQLSYAYGRVEHALAQALRQLHHLLDLLQEDEHPGPTPTERSPNECPTTCPRPSSPSSPPSSSLALLSSRPTSAATSTDADPIDRSSPCLSSCRPSAPSARSTSPW